MVCALLPFVTLAFVKLAVWKTIHCLAKELGPDLRSGHCDWLPRWLAGWLPGWLAVLSWILLPET